MKKNIIVIIVLSILLLGALGYIGYEKFLAKDDKESKEVEENKKNNGTTEKVEVETAYEKSLSEEAVIKDSGLKYTAKINIKIPKITSGSTGVVALNEKIMKENEIENFDSVISDIRSGKGGPSSINISYQSVVKNNIIYIDVQSTIAYPNSGSSSKRNNYAYDITNDKVLEYQEIYRNLGYTYETILEDIKNYSSGAYDDASKMTEEQLYIALENSNGEHCSENGLDIDEQGNVKVVYTSQCG